MAFDNQSFIEKLRMNNIFPPEGRGLPDPLIGMPNFYAGRQPQQQLTPMMQQQFDNGGMQEFKPVARTQNAPNTEPPGVIYKAPRSDSYATDIIMGETPKDKELALKNLVAGQKNTLGVGNLAINQRKQALAEKVAAGKATDEEKQEWMIDQINQRGAIEDRQIQSRGAIESGQIDQRGAIQKDIQNTRGSQALEQIGARIAGDKSLQASKPVTPMAPSQIGNQQENAARQLVTTRPDLAKYITIDPNGSFTVDPKTPLNELSMIHNAIYPNANTSKDIELPSTQLGTPTSSTPKSKTPTAADLIKKYGG